MADTYWQDVAILTHFNGNNDATTFTCLETLGPGRSVSLYSGCKLKTAQKKFGTASINFVAASSHYAATTTDSLWQLANYDFTIEFFVYFTSVPGAGAYCGLMGFTHQNASASSFQIMYGGTEKFFFRYSTNGTSLTNLTGFTSFTPSTSTWYHIAFVRSGTSLDLYIDGTKQTTQSIGSATLYYPSGQAFYLGVCQWSDSQNKHLDGYLDELRITNYVARYTSNFTAPSAEFEFADRTYTLEANDNEIDVTLGAISGYPANTVLVHHNISSTHYYDGGTTIVTGNVTYNNSPASRIVRLYSERDGRLIAQTWSDAITGAYTFTDLKNQYYVIWSEDYLAVYDPVSHIAVNS